MSPATSAPDATARPATVVIPCAFCKGQGTDPFNVLSELSTCVACSGQGVRTVPADHVRCAYCEGTGSYKTYRCQVCDGCGVVAAPTGKVRMCAECRGHGSDRSSGMVCLACRGRGFVPA